MFSSTATALAATLFAGTLPITVHGAAIAQSFAPPSTSPTTSSQNYTGPSNTTINNSPVVQGKAFNRFIQIWLENTDYATASSSPVFQNLTQRGMLMSSYYGVTHPSEPNYVSAVAGDFFGMADDKFYAIPSNVSTVVDLLEAKNVSWASYQENMPYDGFTGFNYTEENYLTGSGNYVYYVRKHNPTIIFDSVASKPERALRHRNFNDFAKDVDADALSQWVFITPNLVNDAHDSTIDFTSAWLEYFLYPLLDNPSFNNNETLILLTFDESETYTINNQIYTIALGGVIDNAGLANTTDNTYYTHYSSLSTVQANWELGSLGRQDTNKTVANVYSFVANKTGYANNGLTGAQADNLPLTNLTGVFNGFCNPEQWTPILAQNFSAVGAGGGEVFIGQGVDKSLTSFAPLNLTEMGQPNPANSNPGFDYSNGSLVIATSSSPSSSAVPSSTVASAPNQAVATGSSGSTPAPTSKTTSGSTNLVLGSGLACVVALASILVLV
ncbi:hypothetical protein OIV83_005643 [Microbotryomycetes sp. JL201]|nr:hypothetical protein OIV83_005643 [Microbotryomycetes sp. JL201]